MRDRRDEREPGYCKGAWRPEASIGTVRSWGSTISPSSGRRGAPGRNPGAGEGHRPGFPLRPPCPAMARPAAPGSVIVPDWHESAQGKEYLACVLRKSRRRVFGERPLRCLSRVGGAHLGRGRGRGGGEGTLPCLFRVGGVTWGRGGGHRQGTEGRLHCSPHPQEP